VTLSRRLCYLQRPLPLQTPEQHSLPEEQSAFLGKQVDGSHTPRVSLHVSLLAQGSPEEAQPTVALQDSVPLQNCPSSQLASSGVITQLATSQMSTVQAMPSSQSPFTLQLTAQSTAQLPVSSPVSHVPSPQQKLFAVKLHCHGSVEQRPSPQSIAFGPLPPPGVPLQQY